jgi:hypothetical protein
MWGDLMWFMWSGFILKWNEVMWGDLMWFMWSDFILKWSVVMWGDLMWFMWSDFILKWSDVGRSEVIYVKCFYFEVKWSEVKWVTVKSLWVQVLCTLWRPYTEGTSLYCEYISLGYILYCVCFNLYCVCFNLYCGGFKLFCNVCVCVCVWRGVVMCECPDNVYASKLFGYPDWGFSVLFPQL